MQCSYSGRRVGGSGPRLMAVPHSPIPGVIDTLRRVSRVNNPVSKTELTVGYRIQQ